MPPLAVVLDALGLGTAVPPGWTVETPLHPPWPSGVMEGGQPPFLKIWAGDGPFLNSGVLAGCTTEEAGSVLGKNGVPWRSGTYAGWVIEGIGSPRPPP